MKKLFAAFLLALAFVAPAKALDVYGLQFLSTGDAPSNAFQAIQFSRPDLNGMPLWGATGHGATWIWKVKYRQQSAYYAAAWHSQGDGNFSGDNYYGIHPYPNPPPNGTAHQWEIAIDGQDTVNAIGGSPKTVVKGTTFTQALRVVKNGDGTKTLWFYTALPSVANADVIRYDAGSGSGEGTAPSCTFTIGDSPWYANFQHERLSGTIGPIKLLKEPLSQAEILLEAADMTRLVTTTAQNANWWSKKTFTSVDDLTDDFGSGITFHWASATKATLDFVETVSTGGPALLMPIRVGFEEWAGSVAANDAYWDAILLRRTGTFN